MLRMPLREDLLTPIPGANPSGTNLRYTPEFEKIKEARRQDDTAAQGDWKRKLKEADYPAVMKLAGDVLATKSKDLQLAAWLTEALVREEYFSGLSQGLELCRGLVVNFWDTLYPEPEDGDLELRAAPLLWIAEYRAGGFPSDVQLAVRGIPLTRDGLDWNRYKESRTIPTEADCAENATKLQARESAIAEGKVPPEEFDAALSATPSAYLEELVGAADGVFQAMEALDHECQERFKDASPNFGPLRTAVEEVQHTARMLLTRKREAGEAAVPQGQAKGAQRAEPSYDSQSSWETSSPAFSDAPAEESALPALTVDPESREDAYERIVAAARYLRADDPYSPIPYLLLRALRWGELRACGEAPGPELLEAPPTEKRQELKRLSSDGEWSQVLDAAESAMASSYGRGWLDLQRYVVRACEELGSDYDRIASAVRSELIALLTDFPDLVDMTLTDDTPAANPETQVFFDQVIAPAPPGNIAESSATGQGDNLQSSASGRLDDAFDLAREKAKSGRLEDALEILTRGIAQEHTGRARFQGKMQLAQLCISSKKETMAHAILQELVREIGDRRLDEWEAADVVVQPLMLLYRCMEKLKLDENERKRIYGQICRLDPIQAVRL